VIIITFTLLKIETNFTLALFLGIYYVISFLLIYFLYLAGCIVAKMGLPIRLVCAVTCNDIVSRAVSNGDFSITPEVTPTLAPAMDIQVKVHKDISMQLADFVVVFFFEEKKSKYVYEIDICWYTSIWVAHAQNY
jgi:hypothetical protein